MPLPPIALHVSKPPNIISQFPPQFVFNVHLGELRVQIEDLFVVEGPDFRHGMEVKFGHEALRNGGTDAVKGFESTLKGENGD